MKVRVFPLRPKITLPNGREFGIRFGQKDKLEGWDNELRGKVDRCWCNVVSMWLDNGGTDEYPATWRGLLLVLEDVQLYATARELKKALNFLSQVQRSAPEPVPRIPPRTTTPPGPVTTTTC